MKQEISLPLAGIRVIEFSHLVMGPVCGMILADFGAEVIKVESVNGDNTRRLTGAASGFFGSFNRNKKSFAVDMEDKRGREAVLRLLAGADVLVENFSPKSMKKMGLTQEILSRINPRLITASHQSFLPGPYANRHALDEVVQMMVGLAYVDKENGHSHYAGTNVNDIMSGLFGALGVLAALTQRQRTGQGHAVQTGLFENNVFLVLQHMMQAAISGQRTAEKPDPTTVWAVYDVFVSRDGEQVFLGAINDEQWVLLCQTFDFDDLSADLRLKSNQARVRARSWLIPILRERFGTYSTQELEQRFEQMGLPFARVGRPEDLFEDPHLKQSGGLVPMTLPEDGSHIGRPIQTQTALMPLSMDGQRLSARDNPPHLGQHTISLLKELGYSESEIQTLISDNVIRASSVHR